MDILNSVLDFMRAGFNEVNAVQGLIIAVVAALLLPNLNRLPAFTVGATLVHLIVDALLPVLARGQTFRLPDFLTLPFWREVAVLLVGYLIVIAILSMIKKVLFKR